VPAKSQTAQPANADALPELDGIDTRAGLATVVGNAKLYQRLLVKFRDANKTFAEQFAAARVDGDPTAATRCAHTLKGTAGSIGARHVAAAAGDLEHACKTGQSSSEIEVLLAKTLAELDPVIRCLAHVRADEGPEKQTAAKADPAEVRQLILKIKYLLDVNDAEALDAVEKLADLVRGTTMSGSVQTISAALEDYDFNAALHELEKLEIA
jgi:HPt (histidine-containing phosphotransfer) domain-containing protein